jgi:hypothetical protein
MIKGSKTNSPVSMKLVEYYALFCNGTNIIFIEVLSIVKGESGKPAYKHLSTTDMGKFLRVLLGGQCQLLNLSKLNFWRNLRPSARTA